MPSMNPRLHSLLDRIGATGSLVCAIHCALLPILIALLPSLGIALWLDDGFETVFVAFASLFGLAVLVWSYRRHRAMRALGMLVPGLVALDKVLLPTSCTQVFCMPCALAVATTSLSVRMPVVILGRPSRWRSIM